jgi:hypothetical protein
VVFHVHSPFSTDLEDVHCHDHEVPRSSDDSHTPQSGEESDHDAESHIHPSEFTQCNAPHSVQILPALAPVSPLQGVTAEAAETIPVLTLNYPHGPAPPLYLQSSALLI